MRLSRGLIIAVLVPFLFAGLIDCGGGGGGDDSATYYADTDGDGYGDAEVSQVLDAPQAGWVLDSTDCDDSETTVNPGAQEVCDDWTDDDCNDLLDCYDDAACAGTAVCAGCLDGDADGYYAVALDCSGGNDCDDSDDTVNPGVDADGDTIDACQDCDDADSSTGTGTAEVCNGLDDDCDRQIDEDDPGGGVACDGADSDLCLEGTTSCTAGALTCSDNTPSTADVCNGLDDDCDPASADGSEDPQVGAVCDGPDSDLCPEGTLSCAAGALSCSDNTTSTIDVCDGADNDCDAASPDGSEDPLIGAVCDTGLFGVCAAGTQTCLSGSLQCAQDVLSSPEVCNGLDDNCDGTPDEGDLCGGYVCQSGACLSTCSSNSDCTSNYWCDGTNCQPPKNQGGPCVGDNECITGNCVDNVCCNLACDSLCFTCNGGTPGQCELIVAGTDPDSDCPGDSYCDGAGGCITPIGSACSIDAECVSGFCRDGYCCSTSCDGTCQTCGWPGNEGICIFFQSGSDPDNECPGSSCDGAGACEPI